MLEKDIERYFVWHIEKLGGRTWKFASPNQRGVADRIACLADGSVWFVELKRPGGRLSRLQELFATDMARLNQNYRCLSSREQVDDFVKELSRGSG
jgi:hypothetical protein